MNENKPLLIPKKHPGESFVAIIWYWLPELISISILGLLPGMIDSWVVAQLGSTTAYGALGMGTNLLHTMTKFAEAIPVAAMAIIGRHNGAKEYKKCGEDLGDAFWTTLFFGLLQFIVILIFASHIYSWMGVPDKMVRAGAQFLRIKSFATMLAFTLLAFIGFMRGVKNTTIPMIITLIGISSFILFDYTLVLGKFGFTQYGLMGSAMASVLQYSIMNVLALGFIFFSPLFKKYFVATFLSAFSIARMQHLVNLSWPIIIDKTTLSLSYVWLAKMLAGMGKYAIASYDIVKNLERTAFLPALAAAQIITFLVSNRLGAHDLEGAMSNIKKVFILAGCTVMPSLVILSCNANYFVSFFDSKGKFVLAATALPIISIFAIFDFVQVVLAGALRGAGDVKTVMWGRVIGCGLFFAPLSYCCTLLPLHSELTRFLMLYGSYYLTTGIVGFVFLLRIRSRKFAPKEI